MASRHELRQTDRGDGCEAAIPRTFEHLDYAGGEPSRIEQLLARLPDVRAVFAERVSQGSYLNIDVDRLEAARHGMTVQDVQRAVQSGIGGQDIAENIEGRERYP